MEGGGGSGVRRQGHDILVSGLISKTGRQQLVLGCTRPVRGGRLSERSLSRCDALSLQLTDANWD